MSKQTNPEISEPTTSTDNVDEVGSNQSDHSSSTVSTPNKVEGDNDTTAAENDADNHHNNDYLDKAEREDGVNKSAAQSLIAQALALYGGKAKAKADLLAKTNSESAATTDTPTNDSPSDGATITQGTTGQAGRFRFIKFELRQVNPHIVCKLCAGYFIGATTIMECLHTFCKSCIVKHFANSNKCPTCEKTIHETNPLEMLRQDRTIQNVVFKIIKNLQEDEKEKEAAFYRENGIEQPNASKIRKAPTQQKNMSPPPTKLRKIDTDYSDEKQITFQLQFHEQTSHEDSEDTNTKITPLEQPYIRTSTRATILQLKKFLARKLFLASPDEVDIFCQEQLMGKEHTLQYIKSTWWRGKSEQFSLQYRQKYNIDQL